MSAERVADELVIYDQSTQMGHCLSATAASVWERCDGSLSSAEIAAVLTLKPSVVQRSVEELRGCGLLDDGPARARGYSRREAAVKAAKVGGAAFMAPLIYSVAIPHGAAAASCLASGSAETGCTALSGHTAADSRCCSNLCYRSTTGTKTCVDAGCIIAGGVCLLGLIPCCAGAGTCTGIVTLTCAS